MSQHRHPGASGRAGAVPALPDLPEATVARLPEYLRALHHLAEERLWAHMVQHELLMVVAALAAGAAAGPFRAAL